jgi:hypothetical protein
MCHGVCEGIDSSTKGRSQTRVGGSEDRRSSSVLYQARLEV